MNDRSNICPSVPDVLASCQRPPVTGSANVRRSSRVHVSDVVTETTAGRAATEGFDAFFRRDYRRLVRATLLLSGSVAEAEDRAQEAMTRVYERWPTVAAMQSPSGYLYRTAMNLHRKRVRARAVRARRVLFERRREVADRLPPLELLRERCEDLLGTVARLDRDLQEAIDDREAFVESLGDDVIFFPTYEPTMFMQALLDGQVLDARRGCLFAGDALLVWPEAFTFDRRAVVDLDTDEVVYRLGDEASLGGGLVNPAYAEDLIGEPIPAVCRGGPESVWLVGEVLVERTAP